MKIVARAHTRTAPARFKFFESKIYQGALLVLLRAKTS